MSIMSVRTKVGRNHGKQLLNCYCFGFLVLFICDETEEEYFEIHRCIIELSLLIEIYLAVRKQY